MLLELSGMGETALRHLGDAVVPRLLEHLQDPAGDRRRALFALQYHWNGDAAQAVAALLSDSDAESRSMAAIVLDRQLGREALARLCAAHADHTDDGVAGFCFEHAESMLPDLPRVRRALARPPLAPCVARYLARYHDACLSLPTRTWLDADEPELIRAGVIALVNQDDCASPTRQRIRTLLTRSSGPVREAAAEYFAWHGDDADVAVLEAALLNERDVYALAAKRDALAAIARRQVRHATPFTRTNSFEPHWFFRGEPPAPEFVSARSSDAERNARHFAWPLGRAAHTAGPPPPARWFVPPTRHTLAAAEDGFGHYTASDDLAFGSLVHVGEDVSWYQDHAAVLALADGHVRDVRVESSWGYIVVVEHRLSLDVVPFLRAPAERLAETIEEEVIDTDGNVWACSLYAHLSPFVRVRVGDRIGVGAKLGVVGRSYTWENGGYPAHLHAGVHLGPYVQTPRPGSAIDIGYEGSRYRGTVVRTRVEGIEAHIRYRGNPAFPVHRNRRWETGYVSRWYWRTGTHGWVGLKALLRAAAAHGAHGHMPDVRDQCDQCDQ